MANVKFHQNIIMLRRDRYLGLKLYLSSFSYVNGSPSPMIATVRVEIVKIVFQHDSYISYVTLIIMLFTFVAPPLIVNRSKIKSTA